MRFNLADHVVCAFKQQLLLGHLLADLLADLLEYLLEYLLGDLL